MKAVILAGGLGTRLSEETHLVPKPMVQIGDKPILWHIMKIYSHYGITDFIICLGYKGYCIKEYFANYMLHASNVTFDLKNDKIQIHNNNAESWTVTLIDTGLNSHTGGRLKRVESYLDGKDFFLTYGDGVADINIDDLYSFHKAHNKIATVTAVEPMGRFGALNLSGTKVETFTEKPQGEGQWINGGFFVMSNGIFDYLENDATILEKEPLTNLAKDGELHAYKHDGFWQPMDTLRDKNYLTECWDNQTAKWKLWSS